GRLAAKKVQDAGLTVSDKRTLVQPSTNRKTPSIRRQCELIGLNRSSWYEQPAGLNESQENLAIMTEIDKIHTAHSFYGSRKLVVELGRAGYGVNRKRVRRLMRVMGIRSLAPAPNTSQRHPQHKVYPYLLRNYSVTRPGEVYSTDITYIRVGQSFAYLTAVID